MSGLHVDDLARRAKGLLSRALGRTPVAMSYAPGRVNLIGEHTDYNEGFVLPMAIDGGVCVAVAPSRGASHFVSDAFDEHPAPVTLATLTPAETRGQWFAHSAGAAALALRHARASGEFDVAIVSNLPVGSGVSSSAAVEVATAHAVLHASGQATDTITLARLGHDAEHAFAGVPCGMMDQLIVALAQDESALLIDCRTWNTSVLPVPAEVDVLVMDTGVRRALADGRYLARRQGCEAAARTLGVRSLRDVSMNELPRLSTRLGAAELSLVRHVVTENARTQEAAERLARADAVGLGRLVSQSHASLRDDFRVSCEELDVCVEAAMEAGALGSRMTGAGFGGCAIALVGSGMSRKVAETVEQRFAARFGRTCQTWTARASAGCRGLPV